MNSPFKKALLPALISSALILSGCGSSDGTSDNGSTTLTSGIITGFGSVYVNGVKFETNATRFKVDDNPSASQDDLRIGMRVKINGSINDDGLTGTATDLIYENELKGPVNSITIDAIDPTLGSITIMGQQIEINADTRFDQGLTLAGLANSDFLEVSGFTSSTGIVATFIEKQTAVSFSPGIDRVEIKGVIENIDDTSFTIRGFSVAYDSSTVREDIPGNTLSNGLYVEVKGLLNGDTLEASKIEMEDDDFGDDADEAEIEGILADFDEVSKSFSIQGQVIDYSGFPVFIPSTLQLADGIKVEAEGTLINGVLFADKIKLKGQKIRIEAAIGSVSTTNGTVSFSLFGGDNNITTRVNQQTEIEDDILGQNITLNELQAGDYVEVKAFYDGSQVINAIKLERDETDERSRLQGPVTAFDATLQSVTLFGQTFNLTTAVYQGHNETAIDATTFYNQLASGTFIKLTDKDSNGTIDEVELEGLDN